MKKILISIILLTPVFQTQAQSLEAKVASSIVKVERDTGFRIVNQKLILTSYNTIKHLHEEEKTGSQNFEAVRVIVLPEFNPQKMLADIVVVNKRHDLALLKLRKNVGGEVLKLNKFMETRPPGIETKIHSIKQRPVLTVGYPKGDLRISKGYTLSIVKQVSCFGIDDKIYPLHDYDMPQDCEDRRDYDSINSSLPVQMGSSGSPLVEEKTGKVIGMVNTSSRDHKTTGSVHVKHIQDLIAVYKDNKKKDQHVQYVLGAYIVDIPKTCEPGYESRDRRCEVQVPKNAKAYKQTWKCIEGYEVKYNRCEKIEPPEYGFVMGNAWRCRRGYKKQGEKCVKIHSPPDSQ